MPDLNCQVFKCVEIPELSLLPYDVPMLLNFILMQHIMQEPLDKMLKSIPEGFLLPCKVDLLVFILRNRENAIAFTDAERGTFSQKYFPDYRIPVIKHMPWVQPPI